MHGQLRCRPRLFGGKLHRQLRLRKKQNKTNNFEDDKIQSQFLYVTNGKKKSKATSGGRNKSTGTSSESGSEIILLRSSVTKRWIFFLELKRFAHLTL